MANAEVARTKREQLRAEVDALVKQYNESVTFAEYKKMKEIGTKIAEKVAEYNTEAQNDCFNALKVTPNPMIEAAKQLTYQGIAAREKKQESGAFEMVVEPVAKRIDPLELHKKKSIGADPKWMYMVEYLNAIFTADAAVKLGLDPKAVWDCMLMSDATREMEAAKINNRTPDKFFAEKIQEVVTAMIGEGFTAPQPLSLNVVRMMHTRASRTAMSVTCATHKSMRGYLLDVCNAAITGNTFNLEYRMKKK